MDRLREWLDRRGIMHRYEFFTVGDHYAHMGEHWISYTTYCTCRYCSLPLSIVNIDRQAIGPLEQYPLKGKRI